MILQIRFDLCVKHPFNVEMCIHQDDCFESAKKYQDCMRLYEGVLQWTKNL